MARHHGDPAPRRKVGFRSAASALAGPLRSAAARRGFAEHRLLQRWAEVAGAELAPRCQPLKISHGGREGLGGTLVVAAEGATALEVQHQADRLAERVNRVFGYRAVSRVRVVQTASRAPAEPGGDVRPAPPRDAPPSPAISAVGDPGLRAALARLEANIRRAPARRLRDRSAP
jgi:hypothetical protein